MEHKNIGSEKIPVIGIGTNKIGGKIEPNYAQVGDGIIAIRKAIRLGYAHIDTSEAYGSGLTEKIVGKAIQPFRRASLFLTSKVWYTNLNHDATLSAVKGSLKRLNTDYLDLYLIHKPDDTMDLKGTMEALEQLKNQGVVKAIGVSNFSVRQVIEAQKYVSAVDAVQNEYNLANQNKDMLDFCKKQKILFIAYRPLLKGKLAMPGISLLDGLAKKYRKTQAQIALNWLISKEQVVAIAKSLNEEHLQQNLGSIGWKMDENDYEALDDFHYQ